MYNTHILKGDTTNVTFFNPQDIFKNNLAIR